MSHNFDDGWEIKKDHLGRHIFEIKRDQKILLIFLSVILVSLVFFTVLATYFVYSLSAIFLINSFLYFIGSNGSMSYMASVFLVGIFLLLNAKKKVQDFEKNYVIKIID
jgi:hypothetical protein